MLRILRMMHDKNVAFTEWVAWTRIANWLFALIRLVRKVNEYIFCVKEICTVLNKCATGLSTGQYGALNTSMSSSVDELLHHQAAMGIQVVARKDELL